MIRCVALLIALFAIFAAACGGSSDDGSNPTTDDASPPAASATSDDPTAEPTATVLPDESELARSLLLTINDFPAGWQEVAQSDEENDTFDNCLGEPPGTVTGEAESGDFDDGGLHFVSQRVFVFAEAAEPNPDSHRESLQCFVDAINDGELDDDEIEVTGATLGALSFPVPGDAGYAFRVQANVKARGETGFGSEGAVYYDIVMVFVDRFASMLVGGSVFSPVQTELMIDLTEKAAANLQPAP